MTHSLDNYTSPPQSIWSAQPRCWPRPIDKSAPYSPEPGTAIDPGQLNQTMAEPNYNEHNTSYSTCMAFLPMKLNWRLTVHDYYDPFRYHPSVKREPG